MGKNAVGAKRGKLCRVIKTLVILLFFDWLECVENSFKEKV